MGIVSIEEELLWKDSKCQKKPTERRNVTRGTWDWAKKFKKSSINQKILVSIFQALPTKNSHKAKHYMGKTEALVYPL